jgi:hypothetical protein
MLRTSIHVNLSRAISNVSLKGQQTRGRRGDEHVGFLGQNATTCGWERVSDPNISRWDQNAIPPSRICTESGGQ